MTTLGAAAAALLALCARATDFPANANTDAQALKLVHEGRNTFRFTTFGDEAFWGEALGLHLAISGEANGGQGPGLSPAGALALGIKIDVDALPRSLRQAIVSGTIDLRSPGTTLQLLKLGAVVGLTGFFDYQGRLNSIGIQCALCHSTVDDSFAKGIGHRRDGWANRDLDIGAIVATAPRLDSVASLLDTNVPIVRSMLRSWGPGRFDAILFLDGRGLRPDGKSASVLIPPAFGLAAVNLHAWTGWDGTFIAARPDAAARFTLAARAGFGHVRAEQDDVTPQLAALQIYQLTLPAPPAPFGSYDARAAKRGESLFSGKAHCADCHVPPLYTEPGWNLHSGAEVGIDDFQADRSPEHGYRTTPLRGLWTHTRGGFYHDGRFATLEAVVDHYDEHLTLGLSRREKTDLTEFLKSL